MKNALPNPQAGHRLTSTGTIRAPDSRNATNRSTRRHLFGVCDRGIVEAERSTDYDSEAPYKGDPGTTSVSLKMLGKDTLEETDKRGEKTISISKMTVAGDGKSAKIVLDDKLHGTQVSGTAMRQ